MPRSRIPEPYGSSILVFQRLMLSHVWFSVTQWTVACQAPLSMGFSRQSYWCGLPFPLPGDLPDPGTEPTSPVSPALAGGFFTTEPPEKLLVPYYLFFKNISSVQEACRKGQNSYDSSRPSSLTYPSQNSANPFSKSAVSSDVHCLFFC